MTDPLLAEPIRGRDALRSYYHEMVFGPYPGARFEVIAAAAEDDEMVLIYRFSDASGPAPWSTLGRDLLEPRGRPDHARSSGLGHQARGRAPA